MSSEKELQAVRARLQKRTANVECGLIAGIPTSGKEVGIVAGGAAAAVVAVELLSPVPTTVLAVVGEGMLALAAACGIKSAVQGRAFWKAAIMGSDADRMEAFEAIEEIMKEEAAPVEGALDSKLNPTVNSCTPWTVSDEETQAFIAAHKAQ